MGQRLGRGVALPSAAPCVTLRESDLSLVGVYYSPVAIAVMGVLVLLVLFSMVYLLGEGSRSQDPLFYGESRQGGLA